MREKEDECRNKNKTEREKIAEKLQISLGLCTFLFFLFAEDECAEINLNATGNNRKTRLVTAMHIAAAAAADAE